MALLLNRATVIDQVAAAVRTGLGRGEWVDWLPGERRLCEDLHVARNTLRAALRQLEHEGLLEIVPGQGAKVLVKATATPQKESHVGFLCPLPLERLRPRQALWIDWLRARLAEDGTLLRVFHGHHYFRANAGSVLGRLVEKERCGCWILVLSSKTTQQWFERNRVPCVLAGTCHEGVNLSFVDLDSRATCRHAVSTLLRLGHRRIAYLAAPPETAGDLLSEVGFREAIDALSGAVGAVVHHRPGRRALALAVRRLMDRADPPTAILVRESYAYLTAFSVLLQLGKRVPEDVSLISREADIFLTFVEPEPACYVQDPQLFARKLARLTQRLLHDPAAAPQRVLLIPQLSRGASVRSVEPVASGTGPVGSAAPG
jgi:LacI family transcriptional regulator